MTLKELRAKRQGRDRVRQRTLRARRAASFARGHGRLHPQGGDRDDVLRHASTAEAASTHPQDIAARERYEIPLTRRQARAQRSRS